MKILVLMPIILSILAISSIVRADPKLGDTAFYTYKEEQNGAYIISNIEMSLISSEANGVALQTTLTNEDGQSGSQKKPIDLETLSNKELNIKSALTDCLAEGGRSSSVVIEGQTIPTCVLSAYDSNGKLTNELQIGDVPFGLVKQTAVIPSIGRVTTTTLLKFKRGQ